MLAGLWKRNIKCLEKKGNAEEMAKLIEVQRGQDGTVLATASDAALNDAKPVPVMDVAEVVALE